MGPWLIKIYKIVIKYINYQPSPTRAQIKNCTLSKKQGKKGKTPGADSSHWPKKSDQRHCWKSWQWPKSTHWCLIASPQFYGNTNTANTQWLEPVSEAMIFFKLQKLIKQKSVFIRIFWFESLNLFTITLSFLHESGVVMSP